MTNKQIVGTCLAIFLLSVSAAHAEDYKGYLGIGFGQGNVDGVVDPIPADLLPFIDISQDKKGQVLRIFGGRQINDNFAVEAGWMDFGDYGADLQGFGLTETIDVDAEAFFLNVVLNTPTDDFMAFYFKAGLYSWTLDIDDTVSDGIDTVTLSDSLDGNDIFYGIGAMFNPQAVPFSVRLGYEVYNDIGDDKDSSGEDVDVLSLDFLLRF